MPQNAGYDASAVVDHILLMAHVLGLGGVWLFKIVETKKGKDAGKEFRGKYGLTDYIEGVLHLAFGQPTMGTIKTKKNVSQTYEDFQIKTN